MTLISGFVKSEAGKIFYIIDCVLMSYRNAELFKFGKRRIMNVSNSKRGY